MKICKADDAFYFVHIGLQLMGIKQIRFLRARRAFATVAQAPLLRALAGMLRETGDLI